jgi:hypothetical protein
MVDQINTDGPSDAPRALNRSPQCYRGSAGPAPAGSIASVLRPGRAFTQFTYAWTRWTPPARRQRNLPESAFERVDVYGTVWRNARPAFVSTCRTGSQPPILSR